MQKTNATLIAYLDDMVQFNIDVLNLFQETLVCINFSQFLNIRMMQVVEKILFVDKGPVSI